MGYAFGIFDRLLFLFSDCRSYAPCGRLLRVRMTHFCVFDDNTVSLFM